MKDPNTISHTAISFPFTRYLSKTLLRCGRVRCESLTLSYLLIILYLVSNTVPWVAVLCARVPCVYDPRYDRSSPAKQNASE